MLSTIRIPTSPRSCRDSLIRLLPCLLAVLALACGSSGGGEGPSTAAATAAPGTVAIFLTDAPADPSLFAEINAVIERIELIGGDDDRGEGGNRVVYDGDPRSIDLLSLRTHSLPLALDLAVPEGSFCKLRLVLSSLELVLAEDGARVNPQLPGNGKVDLVLGDCVEVTEGETAVIQLDIDAGRSIHIVEAPPGSRTFRFRPVIHADVVKTTFQDKVVRVEGVLNSFDEDEAELLLCDVVRVAATDETPEYRGCVKAHVQGDTSVFDNLGGDGDPIPRADLYDDAWLGEAVTVVGLVDRTYPARPPIRIPPGHLPPRNRCRVWLDGTPPGQQPSPVDCDIAPEDVPENGVLVDRDGRPVMDHRGLLAVDSFVVQLGDALRLTGIVDGEPTTDEIPVLLDADQGVASVEPVAVQLASAPAGGGGTRILSTTGDPLDVADVLDGDAVLVDGVLVLGTPDSIRAALVLVDIDRLLEQLSSGEVADPTEDGFVLLTDENVCRTGSELDVVTDAATRFLRVTITADGSTSELTDRVETGDQVSVTGVCQPEGLVADVVLVVVDERPGAI